MGYRSDVVILVTGETSMVQTYRIMWIEQVRDLKAYDGKPLFDVGSEIDVGEVSIFGTNNERAEWELRFDDVKWYDGYSDVDAYNMIWRNCPDEIAAEMIRIGEEDSDVQHEFGGKGSDDPQMFVTRSIERY
jgi:hypothetical protein